MKTSFPAAQTAALRKMIGCEVHLEDVVRNLGFFIREMRPARVGALQVTCSDEAEKECCDVFQRRFVEHFLPNLKFANRFPFRTANLGGRYEWGSMRIAESHFAGPTQGDKFTLMVAKINSHVSVTTSSEGVSYGILSRYQEKSRCCGALHNVLKGGDHPPYAAELKETFSSEGKNRLETLRDPKQVDPALRNLSAAVVNARLQARKCIIDVQDRRKPTPVVSMVLPCVTLNRTDRDTEIVCGVYLADQRTTPADVTFFGLGDDPSDYQLRIHLGRVAITTADSSDPRPARDHRQLIRRRWRGGEERPLVDEARLDEIRSKVAAEKLDLQPYGRVLLKSLLGILLELSPIPAVLLLFGEGLIEIHQLHRLHRLSGPESDEEDARKLLADFQRKVDSLPPKRAHEITELLIDELVDSDRARSMNKLD